ncbi:DUF3037 domain-containing protein [Myxococcota bacterium]|nr:DUF3037 domain-containing protein [Myxococcota bacterium]MBU1380125.1 DUF3037 domain-containing protein [Myxococcota bacterium]MBU1496285.1 DUF3037 domain-containing protein [Myxococcota bacterium]
MSKKNNYIYSIVKFRPYNTTEEFVNVGVVIYDPENRIFDYKIDSIHRKRVNDFFPELNKKYFINWLRGVKEELSFYKKSISDDPLLAPISDDPLILFKTLVSPSENVLIFSDIKYLFSDKSVESEIGDLFKYYVERNFAHSDSYQQKMIRDLKRKIESRNLLTKFKLNSEIGDPDGLHISIPFLFREKLSGIKVIDLNKDANTIFKEGVTFIKLIDSVREVESISKILVALNKPSTDKKVAASDIYKSIFKEFKSHELIEPCHYEDDDQIFEFIESN